MSVFTVSSKKKHYFLDKKKMFYSRLFLNLPCILL